jgi:hypothetical protein
MISQQLVVPETKSCTTKRAFRAMNRALLLFSDAPKLARIEPPPPRGESMFLEGSCPPVNLGGPFGLNRRDSSED